MCDIVIIIISLSVIICDCSYAFRIHQFMNSAAAIMGCACNHIEHCCEGVVKICIISLSLFACCDA